MKKRETIVNEWLYRPSKNNMVFKKTRKRTASKRKYGSKKKVKIIKALGSKQMLSRPLSNVMPVSFHYSDRIALNPSALGAVAQFIFRLNSVHDPDFSGVGHQPVGYDQLSPIFERYQVYKVDFQFVFANRSTTDNQRVGYRVSDTSTTDTNPNVNIENGNCEWDIVGTVNAQPKKFTGSIYINDVHGITYKQYMSNDDYGAAFGSNPVEEAYIVVWGDGLGDDTDPIDVAVHLVYHTKLMGNKITALS